MIAAPQTQAHVVWMHILWQISMLSHCFIFFSYFVYFLLYCEYPLTRESKVKYEIMLKDEAPRSDSTQIIIREEQRTSMNSMIANEATRPKPEGHLVPDVHEGKRKW